MSRSFLSRLLEKIQNHSTVIGQTWLTVLILLRMVPIAVVGLSLYNDEKSMFVCNTEQPLCENVCYDSFADLSYIKFCIIQTILVASPAVLYLGYATHKTAPMAEHGKAGWRGRRRSLSIRWKQHRDLEEAEGDHKEEPAMFPEVKVESMRESKEKQSPAEAKQDGRWPIQDDGLMRVYMLQLLARTLLEVGLLVVQYFLYGFQVNPVFVCSRKPCPHRVDCFIPRPSEKTIFLLVMYTVSCMCLLLNVWEMLHLGFGTIWNTLNNKRKELVDSGPFNYPFTWNTPLALPGHNNALKPEQMPCVWI